MNPDAVWQTTPPGPLTLKSDLKSAFILTQILQRGAMNARKICRRPIFREERRARLRGWGGVKSPQPVNPHRAGNTKQRSRRIINHKATPGFGKNTPGTEAVSTDPSKSIRNSTKDSRPR